MAGGKIRSLWVELGARMEGFSKGMAEFNAKLDQAEKDAKRKFGAISNGINQVSNVALGLGAAGAGVLGYFAKGAKDASDYAEQLGNLSAQTGLNQTRLQEYKAVAEQNGLAFDKMTTGIAQVQAKLMGVEDDSGSAAKAFSDLGISIRDDMTGGLKSMDVLIPQLIAKLQSLRSDEERNMYAAAIFGKGWKELAPILSMTGAQFDAAIQRAHDLGLVMGTDALGKLNDFDATMDDVTQRLQGMGRGIAVALLPALQKLADIVGNVSKWVSGLSDEQKRGYANALLWGSGILLLVGGLGKLLLFGAQVGRVLGAMFPASTAGAAAATAEVTAYGASLQAVALAEREAASAAMAEAVQLEQAFVATGQATEADIAYIASLKAKAVAMGQSADAAAAEGAAIKTGAAAGTTAMATLAGIAGVGAVIAAFGILGNVIDTVNGKYDRFMEESNKRWGKSIFAKPDTTHGVAGTLKDAIKFALVGPWNWGSLFDSFKQAVGLAKKDADYEWIVKPKIDTKSVEQVKATIAEFEKYIADRHQRMANTKDKKQLNILGYQLRDAEKYVNDLKAILAELPGGNVVEMPGLTPAAAPAVATAAAPNTEALTASHDAWRKIVDLNDQLQNARADGDAKAVRVLEAQITETRNLLAIRKKYQALIDGATDDNRKTRLQAELADAIADEEALTQRKIRNIERVAEKQREAIEGTKSLLSALVNSTLYGGVFEKAFNDISALATGGALRLPTLQAAPGGGRLPNPFTPGNMVLTGDITVRTAKGEVLEIVDNHLNAKARNIALGTIG